MGSSVPVFQLPHEPAVSRFGELTRGSDIMMQRLRRVLEQLRAALNGGFREPTAVRDGVQAPHRMQSRG
jgi:hypothetical protein